MEQHTYPLVSIVLPVYNGEKYLRCSIESCLEQTHQNIELIIIDDGSTDSSPEIAKEYEQKDQRVHYYKNEKNLKLPGALNRGFSLAKGDYLTWTSDDNYYREEAIGKMVGALEGSEAEFVFCDMTVWDEDSKTSMEHTAPKDFKNVNWHYSVVGACFMYSRKVYETIGEYNTDRFLCEDYDYWIRIFKQFEVAYLPEDLYVYRQHSQSLTSTRLREQYEMKEKVLLANRKEKMSRLEKYFYYHGLNNSRKLSKNIFKKYYYAPIVICYKVWHKLIYPFMEHKS